MTLGLGHPTVCQFPASRCAGQGVVTVERTPEAPRGHAPLRKREVAATPEAWECPVSLTPVVPSVHPWASAI